jgi:predicted transposase YbfD/YdcC
VESGNDFLIQLKRNRRHLHEQIEKYIANKVPYDQKLTKDKAKGREDFRTYECFDLEDFLYKDWKYLNTVVKVVRHGQRNKKSYNEVRYYVSNKKEKADTFAKGIRGHWAVENSLHREKDVVDKEDKNRISDFNMALNVSLLQTTSINIIRLNKIWSLKQGHEIYANKIKICKNLIYRPIRI